MPVDATSLILVAVMNNPRDLEIARILGWYRIPLRTAPKVISVDYLAFYQTGTFGKEKWQIKYVAALRGHELTTGQELLKDETDHPHARHEYFTLQLGPLEALGQPIVANKWRRITFFYTTGEYLLRSTTVDDLVVEPQERQTLWKAVRERAGESLNLPGYRTLAQEEINFSISPDVLAVLLGLQQADKYKHSGGNG